VVKADCLLHILCRLSSGFVEQDARRMAFQEQKTRAILDTPTGPLPPVEPESLQRYYHFLANGLTFPFPAVYHEPVGQTQDATHRITVFGLCDPLEHPSEHGLMCRAMHVRQPLELPLVEVEVGPDSPNFQLVEDYWSWAWNELRLPVNCDSRPIDS
jgi:hypothetical protein